MTHRALAVAACLSVAFVTGAATGAAAQAPETLDGAAITALVAGKTVEGSMLATGPYAEFYAADGTIRGDGYTAAWSVDGDTMCFDYGEGPGCWSVGQAGDEVLWIEDGEVVGTGRVVEGNPNAF